MDPLALRPCVLPVDGLSCEQRAGPREAWAFITRSAARSTLSDGRSRTLDLDLILDLVWSAAFAHLRAHLLSSPLALVRAHSHVQAPPRWRSLEFARRFPSFLRCCAVLCCASFCCAACVRPSARLSSVARVRGQQSRLAAAAHTRGRQRLCTSSAASTSPLPVACRAVSALLLPFFRIPACFQR